MNMMHPARADRNGIRLAAIGAIAILLVAAAVAIAGIELMPGQQENRGPVISPASYEDLVFVVNEGTASESLSVINKSSLKEIARIPLGSHPHGISIMGDRLYVSNYLENYSNIISLPRMEKIGRITGIHMSHVSRTDPSRKLTYISSPHHGIYVYDHERAAVVDDLEVPYIVERMAMAADGDIYLVAPALKNNTFWRGHDRERVRQNDAVILLVRNMSVVRTRHTSYNPHAVMVTDDHLYVTPRYDNRLRVHDPETLAVTDTVRIGPSRDGRVAGQVANELGLDRDHIYVTSRLGHEVVTINRDTHEIVSRFDVCKEPQYVVPDGDRLYIASASTHRLCVYDRRTGDRMGTVPVGHRPQEVVVYSQFPLLR